MTSSSTNTMVATTTHHEKPFRLLDLPAELWSKIGKLAINDTPSLTSDIIAQAYTSEYSTALRTVHIPTATPTDRTAARQPAITRACRILRQELLAYYYRTKGVFHGNQNSEALMSTGEWLRCIGVVNRRHVLGITIMTDWNEDPAEQKEGIEEKYWEGIEFELVKVRSHVVDGDGYAWDKYRVVFL